MTWTVRTAVCPVWGWMRIIGSPHFGNNRGYMDYRDYRHFPGKSDLFIFLASQGSRRGLERFLEVVCFILAGYGPERTHLNPIRPDFHDF